ncbi:MAG: hypothetical protein FRX48_02691 [Lasallia pustulata]|uniref:Uncharacterized protein n=1 Tax=Lasallia pustulata TaxID=136370 RepID=A0A5M8Q081_9LECA|nr:MAG: hypothetical protein FRX48_02691 [Lasallia pustulata]
MEARYARPSSPTSRQLAHGARTRTSTGTFGYPSSYDGYYGPRSSRDLVPGPRSSAERVVGPRATPRNYVDQSIPSRVSRDDYASRPRRAIDETDPSSTRRPLSINTSSSNRPRPIIMSAVDRPPSPVSKVYRPRGDEGYYLQPASSSSRRDHDHNYSVGNEAMDRLSTGARDRTDSGGYVRAGSGRERRGYNYDAPSRSTTVDSDDGGYEYTNRREQVYRDTAPRPRPRGDSYSGGRRPLSLTGMEDYLPRVPSTRDSRPPVTNRGFDKIEQIEGSRQGTRYNDVRPPDYTSDRGETYEAPRRHPSTRKAVAIHQESGKAYESYYDNYADGYDKRPRESRKTSVIGDDVEPRAYGKREEPRKQEYDDAQTDRIAEEKHRRHRKHRHRHSDEDADKDRRDRGDPSKDHHGEELLAGGLAAAGVAGIAAEGSKQRHRRDREPRDLEAREPILVDRARIDQENDRGASTIRDPDARIPNDFQSEAESQERHARRRERRRLEQEARDRVELEVSDRVELEARERNAERTRDNLEPPRAHMEPHRVDMEPQHFNSEPALMEGAIQKQPSYERSSPPQVVEAPYRHRPRRRSPSSSSSCSTTSTTTSPPLRPAQQPRSRRLASNIARARSTAQRHPAPAARKVPRGPDAGARGGGAAGRRGQEGHPAERAVDENQPRIGQPGGVGGGE